MPPVMITHFSDILCVWAYVGQANLERLAEEFGEEIELEMRHCSVFPDASGKITAAWGDRGGFKGYAKHVRQVTDRFPGNPLHEDTWSKIQPASSASPHLFVKALELVVGENAQFDRQLVIQAVASLRNAFFAEAQDISDWTVQRRISADLGADFDKVSSKIETGEAIARLAADYEASQTANVRGSPTYILNDGRQILFGNISYGILKANVSELLTERRGLSGSPC